MLTSHYFIIIVLKPDFIDWKSILDYTCDDSSHGSNYSPKNYLIEVTEKNANSSVSHTSREKWRKRKKFSRSRFLWIPFFLPWIRKHVNQFVSLKEIRFQQTNDFQLSKPLILYNILTVETQTARSFFILLLENWCTHDIKNV